jgi:CRISPR-associated protein Cas7/Csd2 subtype I-C
MTSAAAIRRLPNNLIDRRITGKMLVSFYMSNPQGDPDNANHPRLDSDEKATMTPMGPKRKWRDVAAMMGYPIHVARGLDLASPVIKLAADLGLDLSDERSAKADDAEGQPADTSPAGKKADKKPGAKKDSSKPQVKRRPLSIDNKDAIIKKMGTAFIDFRAYGGTLTTIQQGERGPIQWSFGRTVDPVEVVELTIGRVAVANAAELERTDRTLGSMAVIKYGLMEFEWSINPKLAERTGLTWGDYEVFLEIAVKMWDNTKATGRGRIVVEKLVTFVHSSPLGDIQDARLTEAVQVVRVDDPQVNPYPKSIKDYRISIDHSAIPKTVEVFDVPV